jgi:hypothetical protein
MDPPFERIQKKSPLSSPYLIGSLSKLLHQLLVPNSAQRILSYYWGFEFKIISNR